MYVEDFDHYRCYAGNSFGGNIESNDSEMMIMIMMIVMIMMIMIRIRAVALVLVITCQCEVLGREGLPKNDINKNKIIILLIMLLILPAQLPRSRIRDKRLQSETTWWW